MSGVEDDGESSNSEIIDNNEDEASDVSKKEEWKKERALKLGYHAQKEIVYNKLLPYSGKSKPKQHEMVSLYGFQVTLTKNPQIGLLISRLILERP